MSDYCKKIADKYGIKVDVVKNLISNLVNKTNYVVHYRNLQLYLSLGMKLTKTHKILKFKQSDWMKKCIEFNTKKDKIRKMNFKKLFQTNEQQCLWQNSRNFKEKKQWKISQKCERLFKIRKETEFIF